MDRSDRRKALGTLAAVPLGMIGLAALSASGPAMGKTSMKPENDTAKRLDVIESRQQIGDVLNRYARGWDRLDEDALRSCFFADAQHQHGGFKGLSQDFITKALPSVAKVKGTSHRITNITIELAGDKAVSECYFASHHRRMNKAGTDEEDWFLSGRYLDRFERRDGVWKIAARRGLNEAERLEPRADVTLATAPADALGKRKPDDPLYALLADFHAGK